jgi:hypothetical protein
MVVCGLDATTPAAPCGRDEPHFAAPLVVVVAFPLRATLRLWSMTTRDRAVSGPRLGKDPARSWPSRFLVRRPLRAPALAVAHHPPHIRPQVARFPARPLEWARRSVASLIYHRAGAQPPVALPSLTGPPLRTPHQRLPRLVLQPGIGRTRPRLLWHRRIHLPSLDRRRSADRFPWRRRSGVREELRASLHPAPLPPLH